MTAPQPSTPEEFAMFIDRQCWWSAKRRNEFPDDAPSVFDAIAARDAALTAPLRAEVERLRAEATAHMGVARAAEAEVARLREALEQAHRYATGQSFRILTDALAEGHP